MSAATINSSAVAPLGADVSPFFSLFLFFDVLGSTTPGGPAAVVCEAAC